MLKFLLKFHHFLNLHTLIAILIEKNYLVAEREKDSFVDTTNTFALFWIQME